MLLSNTVSFNNFKKYIKNFQRGIEEFNSTLLANNIRNSAYKNAMRGLDVNNKSFAPLKMRRGQPLMDKGHMLNSMSVKSGKTSSIYIKGSLQQLKANVHNNGATIKPKTKGLLKWKSNGVWFAAKKVTIPKREFFPSISSKLVKDETEQFKRLILKYMKKG